MSKKILVLFMCVILVFSLCLTGCGQKSPSNVLDKMEEQVEENVVDSDNSDHEEKTTKVPLTFENNVNVKVAGVEVKFGKESKLSDFLSATGLTLKDDYKDSTVNIWTDAILQKDGSDVLKVGIMNTESGSNPILDCSVYDVSECHDAKEHLLSINNYTMYSNVGVTWKQVLKDFGFEAGEPDEKSEHDGDKKYSWGSYDSDSARIEVTEYGEHSWLMKLEFPDTGRYIMIGANTYEGTKNGIDNLNIDYTA